MDRRPPAWCDRSAEARVSDAGLPIGCPSMNYTHLGRTGLSVSRLCLGTMNFGPETSETDSFAIMDRAHEVGINFFDTANFYGRTKGPGATEEIVGRWFEKGDGRRERTVLATKLFVSMGNWPNEGRLSALNIKRACDASLRRLQTDYIDLYQMHHIDRTTPWDEIREAMEVLRLQGKILYVGSSNFAGWHIAKAQGVARARNFTGLVSEQSLYNLLAAASSWRCCPRPPTSGWGSFRGRHSRAVCSVAWSARNARGADATNAGPQPTMGCAATLGAYEYLCASLGEEPATVALAWLLGRPGVTSPIIGPRTVDQFDGALRAGSHPRARGARAARRPVSGPPARPRGLRLVSAAWVNRATGDAWDRAQRSASPLR